MPKHTLAQLFPSQLVPHQESCVTAKCLRQPFWALSWGPAPWCGMKSVQTRPRRPLSPGETPSRNKMSKMKEKLMEPEHSGGRMESELEQRARGEVLSWWHWCCRCLSAQVEAGQKAKELRQKAGECPSWGTPWCSTPESLSQGRSRPWGLIVHTPLQSLVSLSVQKNHLLNVKALLRCRLRQSRVGPGSLHF